jgi:hypothetical protein
VLDAGKLQCHAIGMRSRLWASLVLLMLVAGAATVAPEGAAAVAPEGAAAVAPEGAATSIEAGGEQDPKPSVRVPDGETLRRAQALSRTTAEHKRLQKLAGEWQVTLRTHGPDGKVQEGTGKVLGQSMLGGRYVVLNLKAKMQGQDVEAVQIVGFDTLRLAYTSSWRDNATTWPVECYGGIGKDADVLTMTGVLHDALTPNGRGFRLVLDLREKDQVTVKVYEERGLDDTLLQEQVWKR